MNVKIRSQFNTQLRKTIEKFGIGNRNGRSERLLQFAMENKLQLNESDVQTS